MGHLTRRAFLQRAACAGAAVAFAPRSLAAGRFYVSLNSSLTRQMPWPDFVKLAGRLGYGAVDVNLSQARAAGVDATRTLLADAKVLPAVAGLPVQYGSADAAVFQEGMKQLEENAKFLAGIGCTRMMAVLGPSSDTPKDERRAFIKERVTAVAAVLAPSKIRLGLEFLGPLHFRTRSPHPFIWTLPETMVLAKECGPNVGVVLDAWHWHHSKGTREDILAAEASRIVHLHVSDARPQPPEEVRDNQRTMPGEGEIDLIGFFQSLQKIGYDGGVSPEPLGRVPADMSPEDGARLGLETTQAIMKKAGVL